MITLKKLPVETVRAIHHRLADGGVVILFNDILYYARNLVRSGTNPPAKISNSVVYASLASMAYTLHGISRDCTH